jgi:hypothetical protein
MIAIPGNFGCGSPEGICGGLLRGSLEFEAQAGPAGSAAPSGHPICRSSHRLGLFFAIRTPMPPASSSSVNKIPACSKAAWIRTNVEI